MAFGGSYAGAVEPQIDWDDPEARDALIDVRSKDASACLADLDGRELRPEVAEAADLLAPSAPGSTSTASPTPECNNAPPTGSTTTGRPAPKPNAISDTSCDVTTAGDAHARGEGRVDADFDRLAAAHKIARLAALGLRSTTSGCVAMTA